MTSPNRTSWNKQAKRYYTESDYPLDDIVYYDNNFPTENHLQLFPNVKGKKILELGSGHCNCGIAVAKRGGIVTCMDISEEQIAIGRDLAAKCNVHLDTFVGDYHNLSQFESESFDIVISIAALGYAERKEHIFSEAFRILGKGGKFIFSEQHPASCELEGIPYNFKGEHKWKWDEKNDDFSFVTFPATISEYVNWLAVAGFHIERMAELFPSKIDPKWDEKEVRVRKNYPTAFVFVCSKGD